MSALRRAGRERGIAAVEFALILPVMLVILFGVIEFGRAILTRQVLINVSREAANLGSRGTALADAIGAVQISAQPLDLPRAGFVILSEVHRDANGKATITKQSKAGGKPGGSRIGAGVGSLALLPATEVQIPPPGQTLFVAEVFYTQAPITPLGNLLNITIGDVFYDAAFF